MKKHLSIKMIAGLFLILCNQLPAQTLQPSSSPYLDSCFLAQMETDHIPGISACIIKGGELRWIGVYGYANFELDIPVDTSTLFMLASVSKTITVTALMQLWEEGKFGLEDDINDYLDFEVRHPADSLTPITFRMLCTHTSSIRDNWDLMPNYFGGDSPIPLGEYLFDYLNQDGTNYDSTLNFYYYQSPGTNYNYSNIGAALIGYLVEVMNDSSFSFSNQTQQYIFEPLQMNETAWFLSELDTMHIAMPYSWNGSVYTPYGHYGYSDYPAGQLRTSVDQLANFLLCYMNGGTYLGQQILQESTVQEILTPQIPLIHPDQGLIWYSVMALNKIWWGHTGGHLGVTTAMFFCPEEDYGHIILANRSNVDIGSLAYILYNYAEDSISVHCLPEGITFSTQEEIDNFQTNYPNCNEIEGDVTISGDYIDNLNGLDILTAIGGSLVIGDTLNLNIGNFSLTSLTGLGNLSSIGGNFIICDNDTLTSLSGLENLASIEGSLSIGYVVHWLPPFVEGNPFLNNLSGLNNLTSIGGDLTIIDNDTLTSLSGLENLTSIGGNLNIGNMTWMGGVIPTWHYHGNPSLTSLAALGNITSIGNVISIFGNTSLSSLDGLENICSSVASLKIVGNDALTSLTCLENVIDIEGDLWITDNDSLGSLTGLDNLTSIEGDLYIGRSFHYGPYGNPSLLSLTGLENITSIGGALSINHNTNLISITGLESLTYIGDNLWISGSASLSSLTGLENLISIGGELRISYNGLENCTGLDNVTSIGADIVIEENALNSLTGLDNIEASSITGLSIHDNYELSTCEVQSICDYLGMTYANITIENNAPGCNSQQEVIEACDTGVIVKEVNAQTKFYIAPNPLKSNTVITYTLKKSSHITLKILDLSGQEIITLVNEVQQQGEQKVVINTHGLPAGIYFCVLKTSEGIQTKKLIKLD